MSLPRDEWDEKRIDIIGQNGNDGLHYKENYMSDGMTEALRHERPDYSYQIKVKEMTTPTTTTLVIEDMKNREQFGFHKYGKFLSKDTTEDMLQHLYEELLDGAVYIRTLIEQRKHESHSRCC